MNGLLMERHLTGDHSVFGLYNEIKKGLSFDRPFVFYMDLVSHISRV